jgi:glycosyltransferase involved in cell wall biosynthesis
LTLIWLVAGARGSKNMHVQARHSGKNNVLWQIIHEKRSLHKLMGSSSVVVVPSVWPEPFGRVALEANYLGVPVVASRTGGLTEIVEDGATGFTVKPNNPESLADGITKALTTSFSRERIQAITISKFNNNLIKNRFLQFLEVFGA